MIIGRGKVEEPERSSRLPIISGANKEAVLSLKVMAIEERATSRAKESSLIETSQSNNNEEQKQQKKQKTNDPQRATFECDNEIAYSSMSSDSLPAEKGTAHPRHTARYLELMREKEKTASVQPEKEQTESRKLEQSDSVPQMPRITNFLEPLPLLSPGKKYEASPTWRRKRIKQVAVPKRAQSAGSTESQCKREKEKRRNLEKFIEDLQDKLDKNADHIVVRQEPAIKFDKHPELFRYKIYESFKPKTLKQTRNYINFLTKPENGVPFDPDELSPELQNYLLNKIDTRIPDFVDQKTVLQFDANFESGNLDSVYLQGFQNYNLVLKVDTNTRGNTYWFYFKVLNWKPDSTATFNILNIGRDLSAFYSRGMQILTRMESSDGSNSTEWVAGQHTTVQSFSFSELPRLAKSNAKDENTKYLNQLTFKVQFPSARNFMPTSKNATTFDLNVELEPVPEGQESPGRTDERSQFYNEFPEPGQCKVSDSVEKEYEGSVFCFAYSLPYTYSDLQADLNLAKKFLLNNGGVVKNKAVTEQDSTSKKEAAKRQDNSSNRIQLHKKDTQISIKSTEKIETRKMSKFDIAQKELKERAVNLVKDKLNVFESKLLDDQDYVKQTQTQPIQEGFEIFTDYLHYKQEVVSQSVGGLNVYQLTVTKRRGLSTCSAKKCMYVTARLHAAETHGSWIMKYLIEELTQKAETYDSILNNYIVKLVPMINTDGVTIGNSRSSLVGLDLNRRWADPNPTIHPEIFFLKEAMADTAERQGIQIYCDLHGHNKKDNCFFYGCNKAADEGILSWTKTRLLPKIFAQIEEIFNYNQCRFKQDKYKLNTARVVVWNEMKVTNSFTLETSQYAKNLAVKDQFGNNQTLCSTQIVPQDLKKIAQSFLLAVAQYHNLEKDLELEFKKNKGWFKPQKLNQITGEAARDKYVRKLTKRESIRDNPNSSFRRQVTKKSSSQTNPVQLKQKQMPSKVESNRNINEATSQPRKMGTKGPGQNLKNDTAASLVRKTTTKLSSQEKRQEQDPESNDEISTSKLQVPKVVRRQKTTVLANDKLPANKHEFKAAGLMLNQKWSDLFDFEEIQSGFAFMQKTTEAKQTRGPLTEESSDSCPSVDNFNAKELEQRFHNVLEEETNPFVRVGEEINEFASDEYEGFSDDDVKEQNEETKVIQTVKSAEYPAFVLEKQLLLPDQTSSSDQHSESDHSEQQSPPEVQINMHDVQRQSHNTQKARNITNRIGYLSAQLQEIDRLRQNVAEQNQVASIMNLIVQSNAQKIQQSVSPPSGTHRVPPKQESLVGSTFTVTPYMLQQNYRGPSIQQLCTQAVQSQQQVPIQQQFQRPGKEASPQIICTGTAKFKFNIYSGINPVQVTNISRPIEPIQGMGLQPRKAVQQTEARQHRIQRVIVSQQPRPQNPQQEVQSTRKVVRQQPNKRESMSANAYASPTVQTPKDQEINMNFANTDPTLRNVWPEQIQTSSQSMVRKLVGKFSSTENKQSEASFVQMQSPVFQNQKVFEATSQQMSSNRKKIKISVPTFNDTKGSNVSPKVTVISGHGESSSKRDQILQSDSKYLAIKNEFGESYSNHRPSQPVPAISSFASPTGMHAPNANQRQFMFRRQVKTGSNAAMMEANSSFNETMLVEMQRGLSSSKKEAHRVSNSIINQNDVSLVNRTQQSPNEQVPKVGGHTIVKIKRTKQPSQQTEIEVRESRQTVNLPKMGGTAAAGTPQKKPGFGSQM